MCSMFARYLMVLQDPEPGRRTRKSQQGLKNPVGNPIGTTAGSYNKVTYLTSLGVP